MMGLRSAYGATILPTDMPAPEPVPQSPDPTRVRPEVVAMSNRAAGVEVRVRLETVEVCYWDRLSAIFDRERLRAWLARPAGWIADGEVTLSLDPRISSTPVVIDLPDVVAWALAPKELHALRELV